MKRNRTSIYIHIFFIIVSVIFLVPFLVVLSASFTDERALLENGYRLIPSKFSTLAYEYVFKNPGIIIDSYIVTMFSTIVGTFASVFLMIMASYTISRNNFRFRKGFSFYIFFTMLFSGGLVPSYILTTQYLHLQDTLWVLILSGLINPFYIIMIRTFFKQIPESIFEAAMLDGASEATIFSRIVIPISKPVIATVAFMVSLGRWNDWYTPLLYISKEKLMPLQFLLYKMMANIQFLLMAMKNAPQGNFDITLIPGENLRMAMLIIATGPMLFVFPFFQKYFTKGLAIGAIKG